MGTKTIVGVQPDGQTPRFAYFWSDEEKARMLLPVDHPDKLAVLYTGPLINGTLSLADDAVYDVSEDQILVKAAHLRELELAIHKAHHAAGRYLNAPLPAE